MKLWCVLGAFLCLISMSSSAQGEFKTYEELSQEPENLSAIEKPAQYVTNSLKLVELFFLNEGLNWSKKNCHSHRCYYDESSFLDSEEGQKSLVRKQKAISKIKDIARKMVKALTAKIEKIQATPQCIVMDSGPEQFSKLHEIISPYYKNKKNLLTMVKENVKDYVGKHGATNLINSFFSKLDGICKVEKKIDPLVVADVCYRSTTKKTINCFEYNYQNINAVFSQSFIF